MNRGDAGLVWAIVAVAGVQATYAGCRPTGGRLVDMVLCAALAAFVTWCAATAPWWVLGLGAAATLVGASNTTPALMTIAALALAGALWAGWARRREWAGPRGEALQPHRAGIGAAMTVVLLRLEPGPFFLSSALGAGAVMVFVVVAGVLGREPAVRARVGRALAVVGGVALVAGAGLAVGLWDARGSADDGQRHVGDGLDAVVAGEWPAAAVALRRGADDLEAARTAIERPWTAAVVLVPGLAQQRRELRSVLGQVVVEARAAAEALDALVAESPPMGPAWTDLRVAVIRLEVALWLADTAWLAPPFQDRRESLHQRAITAAEAVRQPAPHSINLD